eukprot:jgi/Psemu1/327448/estExt_fgenesh1_pg.C_6620008
MKTTPLRLNSVARLATFFVLLATTMLEGSVAADSAAVCTGKRLVVVAGPRRSAVTSVAEFFFKYARGAQPDRKDGRLYHPLAKFRWPMVYGEYSNMTEPARPYKRFNHLVIQPENKELRAEIIASIKRDYDLPYVDAVIFGGEDFDQVGAQALHGQDVPIQAIKDVQAAVGAPDECVTIVLNYRVPRFQHWVSLYSSLALVESGENADEDEFIPYEQHMCLDDSAYLRLSELGTSMNPMYLAETYLNANSGWKVAMIDMGGVALFGSDISHTVGCEVLDGKCEDDLRWVKGHVEETINTKVLKMDYNNLPPMEIVESEQILRFRDCAYQYDFENTYEGRFDVILRNDLWEDCHSDDSRLKKIYKSLRDPIKGTKLIYDALLSQVDCTKFGQKASVPSHSISELLGGAHLSDKEFLPEEFSSASQYVKTLYWDDPYTQAGAGFFLLLFLCCCCGCFALCRRRKTGGSPLGRIELKPVGRGGRGGRGGGSVKRSNGNQYRDQLRTMYNSDNDDSSSSSSDSDDDDDSFRDEHGGSSKNGGFMSRFRKKEEKANRSFKGRRSSSSNTDII